MVRADARRWLEALRDNLALARRVRVESFEQFLSRPEIQLSYEALVIRVGDLAKRLAQADPQFAEHATINQAARTRDFVAHHYHRVDAHQLWVTVNRSFADLEAIVDHAHRAEGIDGD